MFPIATLSRPLHKGYVQCTACEHWCAVAPGQAGKCGVRRNLAGALRLVVYGRAIAAHIDPVEKKPLNHFLPGSAIFSIAPWAVSFPVAGVKLAKRRGCTMSIPAMFGGIACWMVVRPLTVPAVIRK